MPSARKSGISIVVLTLTLGLIAGFARTASAQDASKLDFSAGYNFFSAKFSPIEGSCPECKWFNIPGGWYLDIGGKVTPKTSIIAKFSGNYGTDVKIASSAEGDEVVPSVRPFFGGIGARQYITGGHMPVFGQFIWGLTRVWADQGE